MKYLIKLTETLKIIFTLRISPFYIFRTAVSLSSMQIVYSFKKLCSKNIETLIDVGANQGQFATAWKAFFPNTTVHSFEPVPSTFNKLQSNVLDISGVKVYNCGLGSKSGKLNIYRNAHSHASSFLRVSSFQKEKIPSTSDETLEEVSISTLNDIFKFGDMGPTVLKLDVQGFETEVLKGANEILKKVNYIIIEMSFIPMYDGEVLFSEMNDFLGRLGFEVVAPLGFLQTNDLQIPQIDFLYKRREVN